MIETSHGSDPYAVDGLRKSPITSTRSSTAERSHCFRGHSLVARRLIVAQVHVGSIPTDHTEGDPPTRPAYILLHAASRSQDRQVANGDVRELATPVGCEPITDEIDTRTSPQCMRSSMAEHHRE